MTFAMKYRGGSRARAEYRCPVHGVFEAEVERDATGDPPASAACPADDPEMHDVAAMAGEPAPGPLTVCGRLASWTISTPPAAKISFLSFTRGKVEKTDNPIAMDTSEMGEGMPYSEWKAKHGRKLELADEKAEKAGRQ